MEMKMGDYVKTLVDKEARWGDDRFMVPKGTHGLVCEVFEGDAVHIELAEDSGLPFALVTYRKGEYEKVE